MKKLTLLGALLGALSLSVPLDMSFANHKHEVQGKAKKKTTAKEAQKNIAKRKDKRVSKQFNPKPRYAKNINKPEEGELLKLEGMVRDLNE